MNPYWMRYLKVRETNDKDTYIGRGVKLKQKTGRGSNPQPFLLLAFGPHAKTKACDMYGFVNLLKRIPVVRLANNGNFLSGHIWGRTFIEWSNERTGRGRP